MQISNLNKNNAKILYFIVKNNFLYIELIFYFFNFKSYLVDIEINIFKFLKKYQFKIINFIYNINFCINPIFTLAIIVFIKTLK